jgi:hypothetical protein
MEKMTPKKGESRKKFLVRVAIEMLTEAGMSIETVHYDGAQCDAYCLAEDLRAEFKIPEEDEDDDEEEVAVKTKRKKKK